MKTTEENKCTGCGCMEAKCSGYKPPIIACCPECNHPTKTEDKEELIEQLADLEHQQWSHWEKYRKKRMRELDPDNDLNCEKMVEQMDNWDRLRKTSYSKLTEKEKESDREWARKVLDVLKQNKWYSPSDVAEIINDFEDAVKQCCKKGLATEFILISAIPKIQKKWEEKYAED